MTETCPRPAARRRGRHVAAVTAFAASVTLAAGCASIPSGGLVQSTPTPPAPGGGGSACCALIVRGPQPGWRPEEIVANFLLASASFAEDHAIAREYLTPAASRNWKPQSPVTIVAQQPRVRVLSQRPFGPAIVTVSGQQVATLDRSGQYIPAAPGGLSHEQNFGLQQDKSGQWRISSLPSTPSPKPTKVSHELLLTTSLFHLVYEPRNLYFYAQRNHALIADPVFLPSGSPDLVTRLVSDLFRDPRGWLQGGAVTAFPPGTEPPRVQVLPGPGRTAIVNLTIPGKPTQSAQQAMAEQLVLTLTSSAYSPALFQAVKIKINGQSWPSGDGQAVQRLSDYRADIPRWQDKVAVSFIGANGGVRSLGREDAHSVLLKGPGAGRPAFSEIAISPDGRHLAGVAGPATAVYTADLTVGKTGSSSSASALRSRLKGSGFSAPTWDNAGDLWVAGRVKGSWGIWVIPHGRDQPVRVGVPPGLGRVSALKIAPDGVRLAMIVGKGADASLVLAAIVSSANSFSLPHTVPLGPALSHPTALSWYDEDHLLVISQSNSHTRLCEVLVKGDSANCRAAPAGAVAVTAAGPRNPLYLGMSSGRLDKSVGLNEPWTDAGVGSEPAYPG